ncbi:uncharacterized protein LOC120351152 [Nilaparvata lugens]|uniref:uncharacterized protein LOC120351152 n=1 Tax=Nilaparvata lugens TaxID=108931 RepID=UPI00193DE91A|nr:uncharacterized protein LOC120351152 [Nilaparvata lugens]
MFCCGHCSQNFQKRCAFMVHVSKCRERDKVAAESKDSSDSSLNYDSDKDPPWSPSGSEYSSDCESPLTQEQLNVVTEACNFLTDWDPDEFEEEGSAGGQSTIASGAGQSTISAGAEESTGDGQSTIASGAGQSTISSGAEESTGDGQSTIASGAGQCTISAGAEECTGSGQSTIALGACQSTISGGVEESAGGGQSTIASGAGQSTSASGAGLSDGENINVMVAKKRQDGKRIWDKRDSCIFCDLLVTNFIRHLTRNHSEEMKVAEILAQPKGSAMRRSMIEKLRKKGNFNYNTNVLREKSGNIITVQRPTNDCNIEKYLPCKLCLGFFSKNRLYRHMKDCKENSGKESSRNAQSAGQALLVVANFSCSDSLKTKIFPIMRNDKISKTAQEDELICEFGLRLLKQHKEQHVKPIISQKMRELARLKIELLTNKPTAIDKSGKIKKLQTLEDYLDPDFYNDVVKAVNTIAGFNEENGKYKVPSLALKLGHSLRSCSEIIEFKGTTTSNEYLRKRGKRFHQLLPKMWKYDVSSNASKTLSTAKWNKPTRIPLAEDLKQLHDFIIKEEKSLYDQMKKLPSESVWRELGKISLAHIILLNRRRSGEAQRIEVAHYLTINNPKTTSDIDTLLTETEKKLCKTWARFQCRGKRGAPVPVLLTEGMRKNMELLMTTRDIANICIENPYFFAIPRTKNSCFRGCDVLRHFAKQSGVQYPELIRSTKLRKHVATMSQLLNLSGNEIECLATFMGHSVNVHKEYYRLPDDVGQVAKISKLLLALESGKLKEMKGQNFDDLQVDMGNDSLTESDASDHEDEGTRSVEINEDQPLTSQTYEADSNTSSPENKSERPHDGQSTVASGRANTRVKKRRVTVVRKMWSQEETDAVVRHFQKHIIMKKVPNKEECDRCLEKEACLSNRSWSNIKYHVKNMFNKLR